MRLLPVVILLALVLLMSVISVASATTYLVPGDSAKIPVYYPYGTCWYFPAGDQVETTKLYDLPSYRDEDLSVCNLTAEQSQTMSEGVYDLVYTYPPRLLNHVTNAFKKDISWNDNHLVSVFATNHTIDETARQAQMIRSDLEGLIAVNNFDGLEQYLVEIQKPSIVVNSITALFYNELEIYGTSTFTNGTPIIIKVDEIDHIGMRDEKNFTFTTSVVRDPTHPVGTWRTVMKLDMPSMAPGWHDVNIYANDLVMTTRFPISQSWEPVPTPRQYINYFWNGSIKPVIITHNITVIETVIKVEERWHTATPTPSILDALNEPINYPFKPGENITSYVATVLIAALASIILWRDYKWK